LPSYVGEICELMFSSTCCIPVNTCFKPYR